MSSRCDRELSIEQRSLPDGWRRNTQKIMYVNQGDLSRRVAGVHAPTAPKSRGGAGVRTSIVAMKRGYSRGAKGRRKAETARDNTKEPVPATVPATPTRSMKAQQAGEVRARWAWTEPTVWTARMLTALEMGVQGGKWFRLVDKVYNVATLRVAFAQVKANAGAARHHQARRHGQHLDRQAE